MPLKSLAECSHKTEVYLIESLKLMVLVVALLSKLRYSHLHFRVPGNLTLGFFSAAGLLEDRFAVDGTGVLLCPAPALWFLRSSCWWGLSRILFTAFIVPPLSKNAGQICN